jgi:lipoprotein-anchoring transpeptidase ErfK/SrfK
LTWQRLSSPPVAFILAVLVIALLPQSSASQTPVPRTFGPNTVEQIHLSTGEQPGTVIISAEQKSLDLVLGGGEALRYRIGVGRQGFGWQGVVKVGRKAEWPEWRPPVEMRLRDPSLPTVLPPGPFNPLGARAIYLYKDGRDTLYRIHGTNDAETIGGAVTSGCFRLSNSDVLDLYKRIKIGAKVIVQ